MKWDNDVYRAKFGYRTAQGMELVYQLKLVYGKLLEIGSQTGILTYQLWREGFTVEGIDFDYKLVDMARRTTAKSVFFEGDVSDVLLYENTYPMAIANDVLHKVPRENQPAFLKNVYNSLKDGGQMTFDMGAAGNNQAIEDALAQAFAEEGLEYRGLFFPTAEEYEALLKDAGFTVERLITIPRPQEIPGDDTMAIFIEMFRREAFKKMDDELIERIISNATDKLRDELWDGERWTIPYVRLLGKVSK